MKKKLLITGSNGQLGRAIRELYDGSAEYEPVLTDYGVEGIRDLDISKEEDVMETVREIRPYAIINCAAFTNVDSCETNEDTAFLINAIGPRNLAVAAEEVGAKLVHISTDYVFPGTSEDALTESDPVGPVSAYGRTKLAGEDFVRRFSRHYFIIRTAWLYGDGKNFVKTMLRLSESHDTVKVVSDQIGSPTSAEALARAIDALLPTQNYGLFHGTCEGKCSWADFTKEIFRLRGIKTEVIPVTSEQYREMNPASADRPAFSVLENRMFKLTTTYRFPDWKDAIAAYLEKQ